MVVSEEYFDDGKVGVFYSGHSLGESLFAVKQHCANGGFVASLPCFLLSRILQSKSNLVWFAGYDCLSEEDVFCDVDGMFSDKGFSRGEELVAIIHGGGVVTPERLLAQGMKSNYCSICADDVYSYVRDNVPLERVYSIDDVLKKIPQPVIPLVVLAPLKRWKSLKSGLYLCDEFVDSELVVARSLLSQRERKEYFEKASKNDQLGNWHSFQINKGGLLFLGSSSSGGDVVGDLSLGYFGRFVGVAPEAPQRALDWIAQQQRMVMPARQQPVFIAGQGYIHPAAVQSKETPIVKKKYVITELNGRKLSEAEQDYIEPIIARFKNLELD